LWRYVDVDDVQVGVESFNQDGLTFDCVVVGEFRYGERDRVVDQHQQSATLFGCSVFSVDGVIVEFRVFGSGGEFGFLYSSNVNRVGV